MSRFIIPYLNPIKYQRMDPVAIPGYISKHMDDYPFHETIKPWQQHVCYRQPWQTTEIIRQQIQADVIPIVTFVLDCYGNEVAHYDFFQRQQNILDPALRIFENNVPLSGLKDGVYFLKLSGGSTTLLSEPLEVRNVWENSLLLEYSHYRFYGDIIFETGFASSIRILGAVDYKSPASKDTLYEDQSLNQTMIHSVPYRLWQLVIGDAKGIPDYFIDKINRILGCSDLRIDGRYYTKAEGARLEPKDLEDYPMRGWSIEMREKLNRNSLFIEDTAAQNASISIIAASDPKGFGMRNGDNLNVLIDAV